MNLPTAVVTCLKKYVTFSGVASRSEYWWFSLFEGIGYLVLRAINAPSLVSFWTLALFLPGLAVNVRRLHDTGRSGWWYLAWILFPWELVLLCLPTRAFDNAYAKDSRATITDDSLASSGLKCPSCAKMRLPGQNYCMGCGTKFAND